MTTLSAEIDLPKGIVWQERPFPDANFLILLGEQPALIDSGFVAHAEETSHLAHLHTEHVNWVVNTHWHSDHVGANALLQQAGAGIVGSINDAEALTRADPGCCLAEYLDQPVPHYTIDSRVDDGDRLLLGDSEWEVLAVPGHTPGHLALWNPHDRLLAVGDAMSSYDVGWVNIVSEGQQALDTALRSLERLREREARVILPGHGPLIDHPDKALAKAIGRIERQQANPELAVNYGAKRVLAFALMIRNGMTPDQLDRYLTERAWVQDAASFLGESVEDFIRTLVDSMLATGALTVRLGTIHAATESASVTPDVFDLPFPRHW